MAYKTKNFRLKISIGVHSKNFRWGSGLLCLFVLFVLFVLFALFAVVEGWRVQAVHLLYQFRHSNTKQV